MQLANKTSASAVLQEQAKTSDNHDDKNKEESVSDSESSSLTIRKTIGPDSSVEDVVQFNNEFNMLSKNLVKVDSVPRASKKEILGERKSFVLQSVRGITLRDWIKRNPVFGSESFDKHEEETLSAVERERLLRAILVMQRTASALKEIHRAEVSHNDIATNNIMVDMQECQQAGEGKPSCEVKIIGFGMSSTFRGMEVTDEGNTVNDDLWGLGKVFSAMVSPSGAPKEEEEVEEEEEEVYRDDFNLGFALEDGDGAKSAALVHPSVPPALSKIISDLMNVGRNVDEFTSVHDVADDLEQMLVDPDGFLFRSSAGCVGKIDVRSGRLFGRDAEIEALMAAYGRVSATLSSPSEVVLVAGKSGTGKSALVEKLHASEKRRCRFIKGKFDQLSSGEPYSALVVAFSDLCDQILNENEETIHSLGERILEAVGGFGIAALETILPKISQIVDVSHRQISSNAFGSKQVNFQYIFQCFASAVFNTDRPVVLFIDDLQWADAASLEVIKCLVTDPDNIKSLLLVGAYRSNCVDDNHMLMVQRREIEQKGVSVTTIDIGNLEQKTANDLISYTLCVPKRLISSLTGVVYGKTLGNPFFTLQFLLSLHDQGLLSFDIESRQWEWDIDGIKDVDMTDNVVELMRSKIVQLSSSEQHVLELAACVGTYIDVSIIRLIHGVRFGWSKEQQKDPEAEEGLDAALESIAREGLIDEIDKSRYKFAHDRIQQAAYELIPEEHREELHFQIGKKLWGKLSSDRLEKNLFVVTNQLNKGVKMIGKDDMVKVASLNLRAGRKAMRSCAFTNAATYSETGIKLLKGIDQWEDEYELSLDLHTMNAEAQYCNGLFPEMEHALDEIFESALTLQDKLPAYYTLIKSLGGRGKPQEAIDTGLAVLAELGEPFPKSMSQTTILKDIFKAKLALRGKSDSDITDLPTMQDETKLSAMKILGSIFLYVLFARPTYLPSLASRMVRLSLKYGVNIVSALGFVTYGMLACNALGDVKGGCRYGQIGLALMDRFKANDWIAAVNFVHYTFLDHWNESVERCFEPFLSSGNIALRAGDVEYSTLSLHMVCCHGTGCGHQLDVLEDKSRAYNKIMADYKQEACLGIHLPMWQTQLNLMGRSENVLVLTGVAMDEEKFLARCEELHDVVGRGILYFYKEMIGYFFNSYSFAADAAEKGKELTEAAGGAFVSIRKVFFDGLVAIAMLRETKKRKWRKRAEKHMKLLKKWQHSPSCVHALTLLKAEYARIRGKSGKAAANYDKAIDQAAKIGFQHDQALANEKAGEFYLEQGNNGKAAEFIHQAHTLYSNWGARALADHVEDKHAALLRN